MQFVPYHSDFDVLETIKDHENELITIAAIAKHVGKNPSNTSIQVKKLQKYKFIASQGFAAKRYTITDKGQAFLARKVEVMKTRVV